ncbi:MAG: hypothetical protein ABFD97_19575 [Syntrophobacter sp.]
MDFDGIILITTCTHRKRRPVPTTLQAHSLQEGSQDRVLNEWCDQLRTNPTVGSASSIYCGRGFREALEARFVTGGDLWIISAGLGLVAQNSAIPSYSITINPSGPDSILKKIKGERFSPTRWWTGITGFNSFSDPIHRLVMDNPTKLFVIALSQAYARMVQQDISSLNEDVLKRLRLVGLALGPVLDSRLQSIILPYDERLDGPGSSAPGTRSDFAQRAMKHFVTECLHLSDLNDLRSHADTVEQVLSGYGHRQIPKRKRLSDQEIIDVMLRQWHTPTINSSKMLRILRDNEQIACEQSRFKELYRLAKQIKEKEGES